MKNNRNKIVRPRLQKNYIFFKLMNKISKVFQINHNHILVNLHLHILHQYYHQKN